VLTTIEQELAGALQSAHPKIQKMCEEESDDAEAVAKLLEINDSIHRTVERYKLMKAGNVEAANKIEAGTLGTTTGVGKNAANELSLIDFDPEPPAAPAAASTNGSLLATTGAPSGLGPTKPTTVEDDLLGLSLDDTGSGPTGTISLGPTTTFGGGPLLPSSSAFSNAAQFAPGSAIPAPPPVPHSSPTPNYDVFASLTSALPSSKPSTPVPAAQHSKPLTQGAADPFASLVPASSRPGTPSRPKNAGPQATAQHSPLVNSSANRAAAPADEEWTFESSLPDLPTSNAVQVHSSDIKIEFASQRQVGKAAIDIVAYFSNQTTKPVTGLHFQLAVEKSYSLHLQPQSGRDMLPAVAHGITQKILLTGVPEGKGNVVKMRFKLSYQQEGQVHEEQGNVPSLGIS